MGIVYRAEDLRLERIVALKFISRHRLADEASRRRFEREAKAAAALDHPNICTVYEIDEVDGELYIAMACAPGESLADRVARGPLPLLEALEIAAQAAEGLREAHAHGIIHRDVKPSNIFIAPREGETLHVTIMDFGLARVLQNSSLTQEGSPLGTPDYMSPEQTSGGRGDERSDIWALGVALYEMIAGRRPFQGPYREAVSYAVLYEEPEPLTGVRSGLPIELDWVVAKALAKPVEERYQSVKELLVDLRALARTVRTGRAAARSTASVRPGSLTLQAPRTRRPPLLLWAALGLLALLSVFAGGWFARQFAEPPRPLTGYQLRQLTRDSGLTMTPALSADGNLVAYASDRAEQGGLDIWVQQVSGGGAVRLTDHPAADHSPSFSPDGSRIAFRSERDGGGVYLIPALGGDTQLAAPGGLRPRFSPDGRRLTYYVSPPNSLDGAAIFVASNYGAGQTRLHPEFRAAAMPVWGPRSDHIAFWGRRESEAYDVWVAALDGGEPIKSDLSAELRKSGLRLISLDAWDARENALIFSGIRQDSVNLWRLPIEDGRAAGPPERLTFGSDEREAGLPALGRIVYSSSLRRINVWSLPVKASRGEAEGELQRLTTTAAADYSSDVSGDGQRIVFRSSRSGQVDLWIHDRARGETAALTANDSAESGPRISIDGQMVAFSVFDGLLKPLYAIAASGGFVRQLCEDCGPPLAWTADRRHLVYQRSDGRDSTIRLLDVSSRQSSLILEDSEMPLYSAALSRDDGWLAFKGDLDSARTEIFAAPFRLDKPIPRAEWISMTEGFAWDDLPRWSPDGGLLYFTSDRDGYRCIWARRFNRRTGQPEDEAFPVRHLHRMDLSLSKLSLSEFELAVSGDLLVFPLLEIQGNIWMIEPVDE